MYVKQVRCYFICSKKKGLVHEDLIPSLEKVGSGGRKDKATRR